MIIGKTHLLFDNGFQLPKEHGFSVIFICSVIIGLILPFKYNLDYIGIFLSLLFAITVFFSNTAIILMVRSKFKKIHIFPNLSITIFGVFLLFYKLIDYNILIFFICGFSFLVWMAMNAINRGHTTDELVVGSMTLTYFVPLIFINGIDHHYMTDYLFVWIMMIWWLVTGFTSQLILYVQYVRKLLSLDDFVFLWACFITSLIPLYYFAFLDIKTIIVLIEPSIFVINLYIKNKPLPDKPIFKKIGKILTLRLFIYIIVLSFAIFA
jgi:hypothetical protein